VKDYGLLMVLKIHSMTSFRGEVKQLVPCHRILWHVKELCKYERDTYSAKFIAISCQACPASLPNISTGYARELLWVSQES
jgi:hypothetical protein